MTDAPTQSDREIVQRLLSAAGSNARAGQTNADAVDYDWNAPGRFVPAQLGMLDRFAHEAAGKISQALGGLLRTKLELVPASVTQHFADRLRGQTTDTKQYAAELRQDDRPCGLISLSAEYAAAWVGRLLGGTGPPAEDPGDLSPLESAILLDVLGTIVQAFSDASQTHGGGSFARGESIPNDQPSLPDGEAEEYCKIALAPAGCQADACVGLVARSEVLEPLAGAQSKAPGKSPDEMRMDMLAHLARVPVRATVWLGKAQVPMREVLALEPGDVLVIQKRIGEPIDLLVQGQLVSSGLPVTSSGKYGLQITSPAEAPQG